MVPDDPNSPTSPAPESQPAIAPAPAAPSDRIANGVYLWLRDVLISVAVSVLIITFLYQPVRVEGTSMLPRLEDHDRLFINKFVYHLERINRGDIVVFRYPGDAKKATSSGSSACPETASASSAGTSTSTVFPSANLTSPKYRDDRSYDGDHGYRPMDTTS